MEDSLKVFKQSIDFHIVQKLVINMSSASFEAVSAFLLWLIAFWSVILNLTVEFFVVTILLFLDFLRSSHNLACKLGFVNKVLYMSTRAFYVL